MERETKIADGTAVDTSVDTGALRTALGRFATGVTVITARAPDGRNLGLTANSFSSLSLDPPLVLWSLRLASAQRQAFSNAAHFAVNVLTAEQRPLGDRFARPSASPDDDRFDGLDWRPGRGGAPVFNHVLASFECRTNRLIELGDHLLFIGEVEHFAFADGAPLIYGNGRYAVPAALAA
ncbi:flavin reductase family protein [Polymorphobacter sp.]|uniref:flavin reductase family protein n=1 Tax=Polymorphobacter sp. TaxID=1909290 RepID=UPI003F709B20